MLITRKIGFADYAGLIEGFEPGWLYHNMNWLRSVRDGFGAEVIALLTEDREGKAVALTPFMRVRKGPFVLAGSPLRGMYTEFAGPLFVPGVCEEIRRETLISQHAFLRNDGADHVEWGWKRETASDYMAVLQERGYEYVARSTLVVDIGQGADKVWDGFESRARNMVRKAEKSGVVACTTPPSMADMQSYYEMLTETFRRQGCHPPHPFSFFQAILDHLVPAGQLEFISAKIDGRIVAGAIFLCHGERMMYLSGTSNEEGAKLAANSLIQWVAMKQAIGKGMIEYDLGGIGKARIDKFKESFGGRLVAHHRWTYRAWSVKLAETCYSWLVRKGWVHLHG